ncbi:MAG: STAS domain-containing protein [Rhodothermales bacterium]|nr:STAS domain-containing protein [Rhodothermales bacterium]
MRFRERKVGEILVLEILERRLDAKNAVAIKSGFLKKFDAGVFHIAIDMGSVTFIDSSGLGAFVTSMKLLGDRGSMVFFGVRPAVADVFRLTRMDRIFKMHQSEPEALEAFAG